MENLTETLKYAIPALVVFLTAYFLLRMFLEAERKRRNQEFLVERIRISLPVRLQAYERFILFLERTSPQNLIMRMHKPGLSAGEFHQQLLQAVRDEFNHNLSQQLYVSSHAWELVKNAKEEIIRQINTSMTKLDEQATATDLSNRMLELSLQKMAAKRALDYLKAEAARIF